MDLTEREQGESKAFRVEERRRRAERCGCFCSALVAPPGTARVTGR